METKPVAERRTAAPLVGRSPGLRKRDRFDSVAEAERLARRRIPRTLYTSTIQGTGADLTGRANLGAFDAVRFRPRAAVVVEDRDLSTTVLGQDISLPILTAPTGATRIYHPDGAIAAARAAGREQTIAVISSHSRCSIEEVAATGALLWQQIYMDPGRAAVEETIEKAKSAGYKALVLTVDLPFMPRLDTNWRSKGFPEHPIKVDVRNAIRFGPEVALRPGWLWRFMHSGYTFEERPPTWRPLPFTVTWNDFGWIRAQWEGPIVTKGVLTADDTRRAIDEGSSAVIVSNHGGKSMDGVPGCLEALPEVVAAAKGEVEVLMDGGIRRGADVAKALALGARAVLIGRPYLWGLSIAGEAGVRRIIDILRQELDYELSMLGCPSVRELDQTYLW